MISFFLFYDITGNTFLVSKILVHDTVFLFLCFFCQHIRKLVCLSRKLHWSKSFGTHFTLIMEYSLQSAPTSTRRLNPCVSFSPFLRVQGEKACILSVLTWLQLQWIHKKCSHAAKCASRQPNIATVRTTLEVQIKPKQPLRKAEIPSLASLRRCASDTCPTSKKNLLWGFLTSYMLIQINQRAEKSS